MESEQATGVVLRKKRHLVAQLTTERMQQRYAPTLEQIDLSPEDVYTSTLSDIDKLIVAVISGRSSILEHYTQWQRSVFENRSIPMKVVKAQLELQREVIEEILEAPYAQTASRYLDAAVGALTAELREPEGFLDRLGSWKSAAERYLSLLREKRRDEAEEYVISMAADAVSMENIYEEMLLPVQREIGRLWQLNRIGVADEHFATETTRRVMAQLGSRVRSREGGRGNIISTCMGGELHDMGIRMVNDFLSLAGYRTYYTGANTPAVSIVQWLTRESYDLIAISATLTAHARMVMDSITRIREEGFTAVPILVGGYAFNLEPGLWETVGADAWAPDARQAVGIAERLISGRQ